MTAVLQTASRGRRRHEKQRLGLLALAAMAIIVLPWWLMGNAWQRTLEATADVEHAHQVGNLLYRLQADVRDFEASALTLSKGLSNPGLQASMQLSSGFGATLDELASLLADNPEQLVRLGQIKARLERRVVLAQALAMQPEAMQQRPLLEELVSGNPIRDLVIALQHAEEQRLQARQQRFQKQAERQRMVRWVSLFLQLGLLGLVMWLMWRQLNERLDAERLSSDAGEQARQVFQAVREPIALIDGGLQVTSSNPAWAAFSIDGQGQEGPLLWTDPVLGQRLQDVVNHGRELWDYDYRLRDSNGVDRQLLINARQIRLLSSSRALALVTLSDVTNQRAAQHKVEELNRQLEGKIAQVSEVNRELEAFSYSVSHDLRAPLRHIAGFADKLDQHLGPEGDDRTRHYLEVIGGSARRMSRLIDDLLVYSRLGRGALRLQAVDMQSMVAETRALLEANLVSESEATGQPPRRLEWDIAPLPVVLADENMMRQLWINLLGNALKYTDREPVARISVCCQRQDDAQYLFTVSDNGAGFDMAYAGKLFGVFQRMHKESEYSGTGIGLASVRRVLSRHGGRIWAEAVVGEGARFHFTLPVHGEGNH